MLPQIYIHTHIEEFRILLHVGLVRNSGSRQKKVSRFSPMMIDLTLSIIRPKFIANINSHAKQKIASPPHAQLFT
jgi:hypothetical protein